MKPTRLTRLSACLAASLLAAATCAVGPLAGQETKVPAKSAASAKDKAAKSRGAGDDSNIKKNEVQNDPSKLNDPSPKAKSRGAGPGYCKLHIDNRVNAYVNIYIDGGLSGTVSPSGDAYGYTGNGPTTLYGRANFTDGSYLSWGPRVIDCEGAFTWTMD